MIAHHFAEKGCLEFPESDVAQSVSCTYQVLLQTSLC